MTSLNAQLKELDRIDALAKELDAGHQEPLPLRRPLPPADPFPIDALGDVLSPAARKICEVIQAPEAICGQSILAAATLAVQGHADVVIDGRISPLSEFFLTLGESGERKSAVDTQALWPHRKYQNKLREAYASDFLTYKRDADAYDKTKQEILSSAKNKGFDAKKRALDDLGDPPTAPLEPFILVEEPTYEGLVKMVAHGQPSAGLFSDEGGRLIGGHGMNNDNILKTAAGLCGLWDGKPISRVRAGDGAALLPGRRVSFHLMAQPAVAQLMLSNALLIEQGLMSRCLVTFPASTAGTRLYKEVALCDEPELKRYGARLLSILESDLPVAEGARNELKPRELPLSPDAKKIWIAFHDGIERQLADGGTLAPIRGLSNKAPEHAARLAGVLALVDDPHCQSVKLDYLESGIKLVQHYLNEALRLFNAAVSSPDLIQAEKLLDWLKGRAGSTVTMVEIYQYGPNAIREARTAKALMKILVEHGHAFPVDHGAEFQGKQRKEAWRLRI
jgi:hypothetical protein